MFFRNAYRSVLPQGLNGYHHSPETPIPHKGAYHAYKRPLHNHDAIPFSKLGTGFHSVVPDNHDPKGINRFIRYGDGAVLVSNKTDHAYGFHDLEALMCIEIASRKDIARK